ncbi:DUF1810 domain-containing protein [Ramlibacter solisilvae]|nr:DUF1810 domain-containing protein [Ramlibacter tataouinensis]
MSDDPFDLQRFVAAQDPLFDGVQDELRQGRKRTHWMWFVFPQLAALGASPTAKHYGIASLDEARAYLAHPVLGPRLRACCELLLQLEGRTAHQVFGYPDELKLRSCLTLFDRAAGGAPLFARCLDKYYAGQPDAATLQLVH